MRIRRRRRQAGVRNENRCSHTDIPSARAAVSRSLGLPNRAAIEQVGQRKRLFSSSSVSVVATAEEPHLG